MVLLAITLCMISICADAGEFSQALFQNKLNYAGTISESCKASLLTFYRGKSNLGLDSVKNRLIPLRDWNSDPRNAPIEGITFYHYTNHRNTVESVRNTKLSALFEALRLRDNAMEIGQAASGVLWIAGDADSSKSFGSWKVTVKIDKNSKIFAYQDLKDADLQRDIEKEINDKSPEVAASCKMFSIAYFWLEDSGVDIINQPGRNIDWFTILHSSAITSADVVCKYGEDNDCRYLF